MKAKHSLTWFKNCKTPNDKKELAVDIANARHVLNTLHQIIEDYEEESNRAKLALDNYDKASWGYYQADRNGEIRAYRKILKLVEEKPLDK